MALKMGIVGLPNVGKSTLFNALTRSRGAQAANYPFCTIDPNVGVVEVPDIRLQELAAIINPEKIVPAAVEFVDIAGLVKGASEGEGLGNKFLQHIREVDAICHVVRLFPGDVIHVEGSVEPRRDREIIETELALADLQTVKKVIERCQGAARTGSKDKQAEMALAERILAGLEQGTLVHSLPQADEERPIIAGWQLLTNKPIIYAANVSEEQLGSLSIDQAKQQAGLPAETMLVLISAKLEEDLQDLTPEEGKALLQELKVTSSGLETLIHAAYELLGYQTYFTAGVKEVRAWTIRKGATAPQAAGVIHTDFEKGFIRAETIAYADFIQYKGEAGAKEAGKLRVEGKEYVVKDGDVMHFRFNV